MALSQGAGLVSSEAISGPVLMEISLLMLDGTVLWTHIRRGSIFFGIFDIRDEIHHTK